MKDLCDTCQGPKAKSASRYCSQGCFHAARRHAAVTEWLANPSSATVGSGLSKAIREHLLKASGYRCSACGWSGWNRATGRTTLTVDHINGNCFDNRPENLRVLCPNCHALTPTYKNSNRIPNGQRRRSGKTAKRRALPVANSNCENCDGRKSRGARYCQSCWSAISACGVRPTKIEWPPSHILSSRVQASSYSAVGRSLGVSGNSVRKRLTHFPPLDCSTLK